MNNMELIKELDLLRREYAKDNNKKSYLDINSGDCYEFSDFAYRRLRDIYDISEIGLEELWELDDDGNVNDGILDINCVLGNNEGKIPFNLTIEQLNELELTYHVWLTDGVLYYDSECIEGTKRFLELPIYKRTFRLLEKYLKEHDLLTDGIISTKDIEIIKSFKSWEYTYLKNIGQFSDKESFWKNEAPDIHGYEYIDTI